MRSTTILFALIAATASAAVAAPDPRSTAPADDDMSVTITAGKGRLGFAAIQISPELRTYFGAPTDRGVLVDNVRPDSPAARAGLRVGDVVLSVDGANAKSAMTILDSLHDNKKGDVVTIDVLRGTSRITLNATLADDPGPRVHGFGRYERGQLPDPNGRFPEVRGAPSLDDRELQRTLEDMQKRLDEIEQRMSNKRT